MVVGQQHARSDVCQKAPKCKKLQHILDLRHGKRHPRCGGAEWQVKDLIGHDRRDGNLVGVEDQWYPDAVYCRVTRDVESRKWHPHCSIPRSKTPPGHFCPSPDRRLVVKQRSLKGNRQQLKGN